jgi:general secretion pathway protein K
MSKRRKNEEGIALLIALLMVVLLTVIVVEFAYEMQVEASLVQNQLDMVSSHLAAKSAVATGMALLTADLIDQQTGEAFDSHQDIWYLETHPYGEEGELQDPYAVGLYQQAPGGDGEFMVVIEDEWGKLPVNALVSASAQAGFVGGGGGGQFRDDSGSGFNTGAEGGVNETLVEAMRSLFITVLGAEEDPTDAIIDWIDPDDQEYGGSGAEQSYYDSLDRPYKCKNAPFDSIEELLLVRGVTPELFFGDEENGIPPLYKLITVHGNNRGRVNANTAPYETLLALEESGRGQWAGMADEIVQLRANSPFTSREDLQQRLTAWPRQDPQNPDPLPQPPLDVLSRTFHIQGDGFAQGVKTRVDAYVWRDLGEGLERYRILEWRVTR